MRKLCSFTWVVNFKGAHQPIFNVVSDLAARAKGLLGASVG